MTYPLLILLAFAVFQQVEAWPITSYRLFSKVRTDQSIALVLTVVHHNGETATLRLPGDTVTTTRHQYRSLIGAKPAEQKTKVRVWLAAAKIDQRSVRSVRLERVIRRLDPSGGPAKEIRRVTVAEVVP